MNKKLSIIIPVYNVEDYIAECIQSVLKQMTDDTELIVVDDGSTDQSLEVIYNLQKDTDFTVIAQKNSGVSVARNKGMSEAVGEYMVFIDSDDYWREDAISQLLPLVERYEPDMVRFNATPFYEEGVALDYTVVNYDLSEFLKEENLYTEKSLKANLDSFKASPCLYIFKKSLVIDNGILFEENIIHEDQLFSTQLFLEAKSMLYLNEDLYYRRYRLNSITTNRSIEQLKYAYISYYKIIRVLELMLKEKTYMDFKLDFVEGRIKYLYNLSNGYPLSLKFRRPFISKVETVSSKHKVLTEFKNVAKRLFPSKLVDHLKSK